MKRITLAITIAALALAIPTAKAQTASGTLTVSAQVEGSIDMVFNSDAAGVALTGSGTNAATLAFGNVSAYGVVAAGITRTSTATNFTVSSPVDVNVTKYNSASPNYTLKAQLGAVDGTNTWQVSGTTVTSAAQATITAAGTYAANTNQPVAITIPFTTASGTAISNTINFVATAN